MTVNKTIKLIEKILNKKAKRKYLPMQLGDVKKTFADIEKTKRELNYNPSIDLKTGLESFINWYKSYIK